MKKLLSFTVLMLGIALAVSSTPPDVLHGAFNDPDSFMRLAFMEDAVQHHSLQNYHFLRDGAPEGMFVHWTLPFNLFAFAISAPVALFLGWHKALAFASYVSGPLSLALTGYAAASVGRSLGLIQKDAWVGALAFLCPSLLAYSEIGRLNHHPLAVALGLMAISSAVTLVRRGRSLDGVIAAGWSVLAVWESLEANIPALSAFGIVVLGACLRSGIRRGLLGYGLSLPVLAGLALLLDIPPDGIFSISIDRFSILQVGMFLALGIGAVLPVLTKGHGGAFSKVLRGTFFAAIPCVAWLYLVSSLSVRLVSDDNYFQAYFWRQVSELQPGWLNLKTLFTSLFPSLLGLAVLCRASWRNRGRPQVYGWLLMTGVLSFEMVAGLLSIRLNTHAGALSSVFLGSALKDALVRFTRDRSGRSADVMYLCCAMTCCLGAVVHCMSSPRKSPGSEGMKQCHLTPGDSRLIDQTAGVDGIVAADIWQSPEILWKTRVRTIAGPYHRNVKGISDLGRIFIEPDEGTVRRILREHHAKALFACVSPGYVGLAEFSAYSLERRIGAGKQPAWLQAVPGVSGANRLFRVVD